MKREKIAAWQTHNDELVIKDLPTMQGQLFKDITNRHWECIQKGVELYLGYPMDAEEARLVTVNTWPDGHQTIYYNNAHIGNINGGWVTNEHIMKYVWTFTLQP